MNYFSMKQRKSSPPPAKQSKETDAAFDIWLNRGLHELFDGIASEPIPEELLRLIEEDDKA